MKSSHRFIAFSFIGLSCFAAPFAHANPASNVSNFTLIDTENPDILELAIQADAGLLNPTLAADFDGLNERNKRGVFMSSGLSLLAGGNPTSPSLLSYGSKLGFRLLPRVTGSPWALADFTTTTSADALFFDNPAEFNRNHGLADMDWSISGEELGFIYYANEESQYRNSLGFSEFMSHFGSSLYKRLQFPRTPSQISSNQSHSDPVENDYKNLDPNANKLVIVLHGWSSSPKNDPYSAEGAMPWGGDELNDLLTELHSIIGDYETAYDLGWDLFAYNWTKDAWTGSPLGNSHQMAGLGNGVENGTQAAEIGFQHGLVLGKRIREHCVANNINLEKVHFIAHSAGTWVARSASLYLQGAYANEPGLNPPRQQVTLLDPYNPKVGFNDWTSSYKDDSILDTNRIEAWRNLISNTPRFENIYSIDGWIKGTNEEYDGGFINLKVGGSVIGDTTDWATKWNGHGGPMNYYGYTVNRNKDLRGYFDALSWNRDDKIDGMLATAGFEHSLFWADVLNHEATVPGGLPIRQSSQFVGNRITAARDGDAEWQSAVVDIRDRMIRALLLPSDGGAGLPLGPSRIRADLSFVLAGPDDLVLSGWIDDSVTPAAIHLTLNGQPFDSPSPEVSGTSAYAGASSAVDPDGTRVFTIALKNNTMAVSVEGVQLDGSSWGGSAIGTVDSSGSFSATSGTGLALSGSVDSGGGLDEPSVAITPPAGVIVNPGNFADWIQAHGLSAPGSNAMLDDPDGDGVESIFEFYRGTSPVVANQEPMLAPTRLADGAFAIRFWRSHTAILEGAAFQWSPDLRQWSGDGETLDGVTVAYEYRAIASINGATQYELIPRSTSPATSIYLRLAIPGVEQILFQEDWESGQIDPGTWISFGSPLPSITATHVSGNHAMTSNGDASWDSGVATQDWFPLGAGFAAEVSVYMDSVSELRSWASMAIETSPTADFDDDYGSAGTSVRPINIFLSASDVSWGDPNGKLVTGGFLVTDDATAYRNKWTRLAFKINSDGSVTYSIDGNEVFTSPPGTMDVANPAHGRLVLHGRSEGSTVTTHDDLIIKVKQ